MKLIDTVPDFQKYCPHSVKSLREYHKMYPEIFSHYFAHHCQDTDERLSQVIEKYEDYVSIIQLVHERIPPIIEETVEKYAHIYGVEFPIDVNLIVGGFGSNAYTYRQIIPNITFTMERLSPEHGQLQSIVAHEFGHAAHNIITDKAGTDWSKMPWTSPLLWMNQEGAATHFSRQIASGLEPSLYFMSHDTGNGWLAFATANKEEIKQAFVKDYETNDTSELFHEWFSIRGGQKYGYTGLAYFLGDLFFQDQIEKIGEQGAIVAWGEPDFLEEVEVWLYKNE
ncbi:hypothetical protein [Priestia taiwanensis]|uniref:Aminopeptidase n=1 Tax=Priestia taiwanensis TaxID=1347902 RepID=A0A917ELX1_9BACI|nr:hypothetical protein [Priestia taiwanensis]MBM7362013.1 hypothetical protein [Priestia taiwanensis]GGE58740.1 hypothetical protein GCM10007140_06380 [Priestia taiwanensis]